MRPRNKCGVTISLAMWEAAPSVAFGDTSPANAGEDKNRTYAPLFTGELSRFIVTEGQQYYYPPCHPGKSNGFVRDLLVIIHEIPDILFHKIPV